MFNALSKKLGKKGFTLIELIVVIAIIAILAVILIPRFTNFTESANQKAAVSETRNLLLVVQALQTEGKDIDTTGSTAAMKQINDYAAGTGKTLYKGTLSNLDAINTAGTFDYTAKVNGDVEYLVHVIAYQVQVSGSNAPTKVTPDAGG